MFANFLNQIYKVDDIFFLIVGISVVILAFITIAMIFFLIKFNRKKNPVAKDIEGNLLLEIIWIVVPTILVIIMFYYGWAGFRAMRNPPEDAMPVKVTARMWSWSFTYENGLKSNELNVPLNKPVKLIITSEDVLHSLFIPVFRVKEDAVPGMETYLWFLPDSLGKYDLFCTEYCGTGHHAMISKVNVMSPEEFYQWYEKKGEAEDIKAKDALILMEENGCLGCHTTDGAVEVGPSFKGLFGHVTVVITNGKERVVTVDEEYLKKSMLEPDADVVKGFDAIMPSQKDVLTDDEIQTIIDYIKDLND
ncbi:MAG: cytochrome c oxidase subunit II [Nitrospiraceae bacterium]|nr:MAG: cytochrome c oxidase subunit II [Nitrospiraceae bacterium]